MKRIILGALVVILLLGAMGGKKGSDNKETSASTEAAVEETKSIENEEVTPTDAGAEEDKEQEATEVAEEPAEPEDDVSSEFKAALKSAQQYSDLMHMSKQAIYDQLISEYGNSFPEEAAQYAIDNVEANWEENALSKAEDYAKTMHMSKMGIYDQLISEYGEQFTEDEAQYAIDNIEADWNRNALEKAKSYRDTMGMSNDEIRDQENADNQRQRHQQTGAEAVMPVPPSSLFREDVAVLLPVPQDLIPPSADPDTCLLYELPPEKASGKPSRTSEKKGLLSPPPRQLIRPGSPDRFYIRLEP